MIECIDLGLVDHSTAIYAMQGWVRERRGNAAPDRLFLLEHPPVLTYGRATRAEEINALPAGIEAVSANRGGHVTYHGPGQLVGYLVVGLADRSVGQLVRWVENTLVAALGDLGIDATRFDTPKGRPSMVGVWTTEGEKIASVGMRIRDGVTSHGFALNVDPDLSVFRRFTACDLPDVEMTSIAELAIHGRCPVVTLTEAKHAVADRFGDR